MYDLISKAADLLTGDAVKTDNLMLRLHYMASVTIFVGYSMIITVSTYAGDPIDCITSKGTQGAPPGNFLDTYCYIHGTSTLDWYVDINAGSHRNIKQNCEGDECDRKHYYYQWVSVVCLLQAALFYLPHYLWMGWEGGMMERMIGTLATEPKYYIDADQQNARSIYVNENFSGFFSLIPSSGCKRTRNLSRIMLNTFGENRLYVFKFYFLEFLSAAIAFVQFFLTDMFLGGSYTKNGASLPFDLVQVESNRTDRLEWSLPIISGCTYTQYGSGGGIKSVQSVCVLPNNVVHQKFYTFLYFWLLFVMIYSTAHSVFRLAIIVNPIFRGNIASRYWGETDIKESTDHIIRHIYSNISFSDWQMISFVHSNLAEYNFVLFLEDLSFDYFEKNQDDPKFQKDLLSRLNKDGKKNL